MQSHFRPRGGGRGRTSPVLLLPRRSPRMSYRDSCDPVDCAPAQGPGREGHFLMRDAMTRFRLAWALPMLALSMGAAPDSGREDEKVFPFPIRRTTLDNGLSVLSVPFDSPGIIAYYTVVRTGSRNEVERGLSGFAHFFEHMMFRGTERYPQA